MSELERQERLRALMRELRGTLSQRAFSKHIGINYGSLQAYEAGEAFPSFKSMEKIAQARGWTLDELQAYLDGREVGRKLSVKDIIYEVRQLPPNEAATVAKVALDVAIKGILVTEAGL